MMYWPTRVGAWKGPAKISPGKMTSGEVAPIICSPNNTSVKRGYRPVIRPILMAHSRAASRIVLTPAGTIPKVRTPTVRDAKIFYRADVREELQSPEQEENTAQADAEYRDTVAHEPSRYVIL